LTRRNHGNVIRAAVTIDINSDHLGGEGGGRRRGEGGGRRRGEGGEKEGGEGGRRAVRKRRR
jgi:hypothetical protein